jgi:hypothetical protein
VHIDEARIIELFAERQPFYDPAEVERLLGVSCDWLAEAVVEGRLGPVSLDTGPVFAWNDVAGLVLEWRTPREIAGIMARAGHDSAVPFLNRFRTISIELPVYQIRLLHQLAAAGSEGRSTPLTVSDVLEYELEGIAHGEGNGARALIEAIASVSPGSFHDERQLAGGCLYCGAPAGGCEPWCAACAALHVPSVTGRECHRDENLPATFECCVSRRCS